MNKLLEYDFVRLVGIQLYVSCFVPNAYIFTGRTSYPIERALITESEGFEDGE